MTKGQQFLNPQMEVTQIAVPAGWTYTLPFNIIYDGTYKPDGFNLQTHANISVTTTYYVDPVTGNDGNSGADWANALKAISTALVKADVDRIILASEYYYRSTSWSATNPSRSIEVIGDSSRGSLAKPVVTANCYNQIGAYSPDSNHYDAATSRTVAGVWDMSNVDAHGHGQLMTEQVDEATVDSTPNSWYQDGSKNMHVRTFDDRAPDADLFYSESGSPLRLARDNVTLYLENITFLGGRMAADCENASATGGAKIYAYRCDFGYSYELDLFNDDGLTESIFRDCTFFASGADGINHHAQNSVVPDAIEINCTFLNCGLLAGAMQCSTMHDQGRILRIGGNYSYAQDQIIADATAGTLTWMLGSELHNSQGATTSNANFYSEGTAWLDGIYSHDSTYDLVAAAGATINYRGIRSGGNNIATGTIQAY